MCRKMSQRYINCITPSLEFNKIKATFAAFYLAHETLCCAKAGCQFELCQAHAFSCISK